MAIDVDRSLIHKIGDIATRHGEIISSKLNAPYGNGKLRLDRFDMQVGISASGQIGLLTFSGSPAVEFIWQRNLETLPGDDIDEEEPTEEVELAVGLASGEEIFKGMFSEISKFLGEQRLKKRRKVIRLLRRDAQRISKLVRNLIFMPRIGNWYVGGFFKNYSFSNNLSLGAISLGGSKRLRFRFRVNRVPYQSDDKLSLGQKKLKTMMEMFNNYSESSLKFNQFLLKRVFAVHTLEAGLDIGIYSTSASKGVQIEYKKVQDSKFVPYSNYNNFVTKISPLKFINEKIISYFDRKTYDDTKDLSLHQIRVKYSTSNGIDFALASVEKSSTLEFHYKR